MVLLLLLLLPQLLLLLLKVPGVPDKHRLQQLPLVRHCCRHSRRCKPTAAAAAAAAAEGPLPGPRPLLLLLLLLLQLLKQPGYPAIAVV